MQIDPDGWLDAGAWFIQEMNYVLDRLDFEEQIVKTIPKENTSKHKGNQTRRGQEITLPSLGAIKEIGDYRGRRSEDWHQLKPTQEVDIGR